MSSARDFDFLHGSWTVIHRKLRARLAGCDEWDHFSGTLTCLSTSGGFGNTDDCWLADPSGAYGAIAIRSFNPIDCTWAIWWLDQRSSHHLDPPVVGSFVDGVGTFVADDEFAGRSIIVRFRWLDTTTPNPKWDQAFSVDGGATWEVNWEMVFTPARASTTSDRASDPTSRPGH